MTTVTHPSGTLPAPAPPASRLRPVAVGSAVAFAAFAGVVALAGALDPGYSQVGEGISALASTESHSAGLMTAGFVLLAATAVASGVVILRSLPGRAGRAAGALVVLGGLLTMVCGFARQSCSSLQQACLDRESTGTVSTAHWVHNLTALAPFAALVLGGFLLAAGLRRSSLPRGNSLPRGTGRRYLVAAILALAFMVWFGSAAYGDAGGLVERGLVLLTYGTPVAAALHLTRR